jgi:hypothetical protein
MYSGGRVVSLYTELSYFKIVSGYQARQFIERLYPPKILSLLGAVKAPRFIGLLYLACRPLERFGMRRW